MFFTRPLAQASRNSAFEMSPLPSLSTCVKLTMNGAAFDLANKSPDGTALFQIASHCSGFRTAEGRPEVMLFACASAQVTVNGSTTTEMMGALNTLSPPGSRQRGILNVRAKLGLIGRGSGVLTYAGERTTKRAPTEATLG